MLSIILHLLFFVLANKAELPQLSSNTTILQKSISSCILMALNEVPTDNIATLVVTDQILLATLHQETRWSTILLNGNVHPMINLGFYKISDIYIIQIETDSNFEMMLESLNCLNSWNPNARFIIISTAIFNNPQHLIQKIFASLWNQKVLNAVIMLPQLLDNSKLDIYSWFPYKNKNCGDKYEEACVINTCQMGQMNKNQRIFLEKIPNDLNGCPVRIRVVIWPPYVIAPQNYVHITQRNISLTDGIEVKLMDTIAQIAKFTSIYSVSGKKQNWGNITRNGTATGLMHTVLTGVVDIGMGAVAMPTINYQMFDSSISYIWESVTWCIPHALPIPKWKSLINVFQLAIWFWLLVSFVLEGLVAWGFGLHQVGESTSYRSWESCFQNLLSLLLGLAVKKLPRSIKLRLILILWIIGSLHLNAAFTSSLIRDLTQPTFESSANSLHDLIKAGYQIGLVPPATRFRPQILNNITWKFCSDVRQCLERTAFDRNFAVGLPRMYVQYIFNKYLLRKGHLIYWMKDDIASYPVVLIAAKGYPLLQRINPLINRIVEAGLIAKWQDDFLSVNGIKIVSIKVLNKSGTSLTVRHLEGAFILLSIGFALATIIFILELITFKRHQKRNKKIGSPENYFTSSTKNKF